MSADVSWSFTAKDKCENNKGGNGLLTCALIFSHWEILQGAGVADPNWKCYDKSFSVKNFTTVKGDEIIFVAIYKYPPDSGTCVAEGTMITLADGSQKAVESLTGDELLLVWNHRTGTFDAAPITFVQSNALSMYELIHLYFSDGTEIKVSYEHAFWDFNLNRYVMIRNGEAEQYIGHWFNKQITDANGNMTWTKVQLISVEVYTEYLRVYSPVTFAHLNFYVNGLLSMPGDTEGLINIFEMDADTLQYNQDAMTADIELYGLFEYADFADMIPEEIFEAFQVQYLSISLGKGLITWDRIEYLIGEFAAYWDAI